jgi:hypothetical protein
VNVSTRAAATADRFTGSAPSEGAGGTGEDGTGQCEDAAEDDQCGRHDRVDQAPAPPARQQGRDQQRPDGGAEPVAGVHPVDVAGAEVPGGVRVEGGIERPEADAEQHGPGDQHPQGRRGGFGGQGERDQPGGRRDQGPGADTGAAGDGAGDDRGDDPGHQDDPERPDRRSEAEPHRRPQQAEGGTGQGDAEVRQASEKQGRHGWELPV